MPEVVARLARDAARCADTPAERERLLALAAVAGLVLAGAGLTLQRAAAIAGASPQSVAVWASQHGFGRKVAGRWLIDTSAFVAFLEGGHRG